MNEKGGKFVNRVDSFIWHLRVIFTQWIPLLKHMALSLLPSSINELLLLVAPSKNFTFRRACITIKYKTSCLFLFLFRAEN